MSEPTRAMRRVRSFALPDTETGELVTLDSATLIDTPPPDDYERSGIATLDDVEGRHPALAIKTSLKERVGEVITIIEVDYTATPSQFLAEKRAKGQEPEEYTAVLNFRGEDGRYYVAVCGNARMMRATETLRNLLRRVTGVRCRVVAYTSSAGTGYGLGAVGG